MKIIRLFICMIFLFCSYVETWGIEPTVSQSKQSLPCPFVQDSKEDEVLIAWVTNVRETTSTKKTIVGPFRPIVILKETNFKETIGASIYKGQNFWRVLSPSSKPVKLTSIGSFLDQIGNDHCVYFGSFGNSILQPWTLLSNKPLPDIFRLPTPNESQEFNRLNTTCVHQGDHPKNNEPPCTRPKLLAITDINKNGNLEYWATEPYTWDTGLTIWEKNGNKLTTLLKVCVGCSD